MAQEIIDIGYISVGHRITRVSSEAVISGKRNTRASEDLNEYMGVKVPGIFLKRTSHCENSAFMRSVCPPRDMSVVILEFSNSRLLLVKSIYVHIPKL